MNLKHIFPKNKKKRDRKKSTNVSDSNIQCLSYCVIGRKSFHFNLVVTLLNQHIKNIFKKEKSSTNYDHNFWFK